MSVGAPDANLGAEERLNEVARLLALGYLRLRERQRANHPCKKRNRRSLFWCLRDPAGLTPKEPVRDADRHDDSQHDSPWPPLVAAAERTAPGEHVDVRRENAAAPGFHVWTSLGSRARADNRE